MMKKRDYIQENLRSSDPYIRELFTELNKRFVESGNESEVVDRMKLSDARGPILITSVISFVFLLILFT